MLLEDLEDIVEKRFDELASDFKKNFVREVSNITYKQILSDRERKDTEIKELNKEISDEKIIYERDTASLREGKDFAVNSLKEKIAEKDREIQISNNSIEQLNSEIKKKDEELKQKDSEINGLDKQIEQKNFDIANTKQDYEKIKTASEQKQKDLEYQINSLGTTINNLTKTLNEYKAKYFEADEAFENFRRLDSETKKQLEERFSPDCDIMAFLASGANDVAVKALYELARNRILYKHGTDDDQIIAIYKFFLTMFLKKAGKIPCERIEPNIGDAYDINKHNSIDGKTSGTVSKVVLIGFNQSNGKALVELND